MMRHWATLGVLVALVAAWHLGAALPLNEVEDVVLLEKAAATPAQKAAKKQVNKTKQEVAKALAKVHAKGINAKGSVAPTTTTAATTAAATTTAATSIGSPPENIVPGSTSVAVPSLPSTDKITTKQAPLAKPKGKKHINRDIPVGKKGYLNQQAEKSIMTGDHEIHKINTRLVKEREARYDEARGAVELQQASSAAARAAANLASAIRKTAADKAAKADARVSMLKTQIAKAKGKAQAGLQIKLAKATAKQNALMKKAALAGKAVNQAIAKAASVEGRATAQAVADQDETTRLEHAIVAAASAKLKLAAFDKETAVANKLSANDKKVKKYWNKQQDQIHKKIEVAKNNYKIASTKAAAAEHKSAVAAALAFAKKAHLANTVVATAVSTKPKKQVKAATTTQAPAPAPPVSSTAVNAATAAASLKAAQAAANAAVATAHRTGKASDSKLAEKAIAHMQNMKNSQAKKRL